MSVFNFHNVEDAISGQEAEKLVKERGDFFPVNDWSEVEIIHVEYKKPLEKDNSWHGFSLVLGRPGSKYNPNDKKAYDLKANKSVASCYQYLCVPGNNSLKYQGDQTKGVRLASRVVDFLSACGFDSNFDTLSDLIVKNFASDINALKGKRLAVFRAYKNDYIKYTEDGFQICAKDGNVRKEFENELYENKDAAIAAYMGTVSNPNLQIDKTYPENTNFRMAEGVTAEEPKDKAVEAAPVVEESEYE